MGAFPCRGHAGFYGNGHRTSDTYKIAAPAGSTSPCWTTACTATYTYDAKDRLVSSTDGHGTTFAYDLNAAGSTESETITQSGVSATRSFTYEGSLLTSTTPAGQPTQRYWHDADGNLECTTLDVGSDLGTRDDCGVGTGVSVSPQLLAQYKHNYLNQMRNYRSFTTNGTTSTADDDSTYEHDALDRVVKQREKHGTGAERVIDFSHVALSSLLSTEKHTVGGTLEKTLTYGYDAAGHRMTMGDTRGLNTDRYTYGYDVHGNTSLLVNQSGGSVGQPKASYGYRPYGDPDTALTLGDPQDDDPVNPMRYSARRYDSGSGSLDMGARRYQSGIGRFLQFDQYSGALSDLSLSSDPLTGNRYALAGGNPVGFLEWDGHIAYRNGCGTGSCVTPEERQAAQLQAQVESQLQAQSQKWVADQAAHLYMRQSPTKEFKAYWDHIDKCKYALMWCTAAFHLSLGASVGEATTAARDACRTDMNYCDIGAAIPDKVSEFVLIDLPIGVLAGGVVKGLGKGISAIAGSGAGTTASGGGAGGDVRCRPTGSSAPRRRRQDQPSPHGAQGSPSAAAR